MSKEIKELREITQKYLDLNCVLYVEFDPRHCSTILKALEALEREEKPRPGCMGPCGQCYADVTREEIEQEVRDFLWHRSDFKFAFSEDREEAIEQMTAFHLHMISKTKHND